MAKADEPVDIPKPEVTASLEAFLGLTPPRMFVEGEFVDSRHTGRTLLFLHSLVERAVKTTFAAMVTEQFHLQDAEQEAFFSVIAKRFADAHRQYSDAQEILRSYFKALDDQDASAAFDRFQKVTQVRNRIVHGAYTTFDVPIEELSGGSLKFADLWPITKAAVDACYRHAKRAPDLWKAIEQEMAAEADGMHSYDVWRGK